MPGSPTILRRYLSTSIDAIFIMSVFIAASFAVTSDSPHASNARVAVLVTMLFFYEPLFTSRFCTVGQKITGIRVRAAGSYKRISLPAAYL
jgi:K+-sensing histidine kinase KdpD